MCHVVPNGAGVRRFWPVFGTLEYAAGTMDAGWPPNAGERAFATFLAALSPFSQRNDQAVEILPRRLRPPRATHREDRARCAGVVHASLIAAIPETSHTRMARRLERLTHHVVTSNGGIRDRWLETPDLLEGPGLGTAQPKNEAVRVPAHAGVEDALCPVVVRVSEYVARGLDPKSGCFDGIDDEPLLDAVERRVVRL